MIYTVSGGTLNPTYSLTLGSVHMNFSYSTPFLSRFMNPYWTDRQMDGRQTDKRTRSHYQLKKWKTITNG